MIWDGINKYQLAVRIWDKEKCKHKGWHVLLNCVELNKGLTDNSKSFSWICQKTIVVIVMWIWVLLCVGVYVYITLRGCVGVLGLWVYFPLFYLNANDKSFHPRKSNKSNLNWSSVTFLKIHPFLFSFSSLSVSYFLNFTNCY